MTPVTVTLILLAGWLLGLAAALIVVTLRERRHRQASVAERRALWAELPVREQHLVETMTAVQEVLAAMSNQARENSARIERLRLDAAVRARADVRDGRDGPTPEMTDRGPGPGPRPTAQGEGEGEGVAGA
jgi:hypothetical protein